MTLSDLISHAREYGQEPSTKRHTDASITIKINLRYMEIIRTLRQRRTIRLDISENNGQYKFVLPEGITEIESIVLVGLDTYRCERLEARNYEDFLDEIGREEVKTNCRPRLFTVSGNTLRLDAAISSTLHSHLEFTVFDVPAVLTDANDVPEFTSAFHDILACGAAALLYLEDKDGDLYQVWEKKFLDGAKQLHYSARRIDEQGIKQVKDVRRGNMYDYRSRRFHGVASYS